MTAVVGRAYTVHHDLTGLAGGTRVEYKAVVRDGRGRTASARSAATVGTPVQGGSRDWAVVHYQRPAGGYDEWSLYAWGDVDPAYLTEWPDGQPFAGEDSYGRFAWVKLKPGAKSVGFLVVDEAGNKDVGTDRTIDVTQAGEVWSSRAIRRSTRPDRPPRMSPTRLPTRAPP